MKKPKQLNCYDCLHHGTCDKDQKFVMPCSDFNTLCCGWPTSKFQESADVIRTICVKPQCKNTGQVHFADATRELPDLDEIMSPWQVDDSDD